MTTMPAFWRVMCLEALGLDDHQAWSFWRALSKSAWTDCVAFRAALVRYDALPTPRPKADRQQVQALLAPASVLPVVEALVTQHLLLKRDAGQIEEAILTYVDRHGAWMQHEKEMV